MKGLEKWQDRLCGHFGSLREERPSGRPLFVLEHGLEAAERDALAGSVRSDIQLSPPSAEYPLPWIVYATEIGYSFAGTEYWQTFENETPGWREHGRRRWLRRRFQKFSEQFSGARPEGDWADKFSIIAWPITHAIVPKDLQQHLVEILHDLQFSFAADDFGDIERLGRRVRSQALRSNTVSERFRSFTEQTALVGQVTAALLSSEVEGGYIRESVLDRIKEDLDQIQKRHLLESTQKSVRRTRVWGLRRSKRRRAGPSENGETAGSRKQRADALGLQSRFLLQKQEEGSYTAILDVPALEPLSELGATFDEALSGSRVEVRGGKRDWFPSRYFADASRSVTLESWPRPGEPLIEFTKAAEKVNEVLRAESFFAAGPVWLFKESKDGRAREIRTRRVQPGSSYVLVGRGGVLDDLGVGVRAHIDCDEAEGVRIDVPEALSDAWEEALDRLGISVAGAVEVWPAGLVPARWDGEGTAAWLATDDPCIGARSNRPVERFRIELGKKDQVEAIPAETGAPVFVQLPTLPVGKHEVTVRVETGGEVETGHLEVIIEDPPSRNEPSSEKWPLSLFVEPPTPSLEHLWSGEARLHIDGPSGRTVQVQAALYDSDGYEPLAERTVHEVALPVSFERWGSLFEEEFRETPGFQEQYDFAHTCEITVDGGELGNPSLRCERKLTPVRWVRKKENGRSGVMLIDDTGQENDTKVLRYQPSSPLQPAEQQHYRAVDEYESPKSGALYHAHQNDFSDATLVPPQVERVGKGTGFGALVPESVQVAPTVEDVLGAVEAAGLWRRPQTGNPFGRNVQSRVLQVLSSAIVEATCGKEWKDKEKQWWAHPSSENRRALANIIEYRRGHASEYTVDQFFSDEKIHAQQAVSVRRKALNKIFRRNGWVRPRPVNTNAGRNYSKLIQTSGPSAPHWMAMFALRIMSAPGRAAGWAGDHLEDGLEKLLEEPSIARAARLTVLLIDHCSESEKTNHKELYRGWEWR